jgi:hypothetical protein
MSSIDSGLAIEYSLEALEYGSIKTKIAQIIREIPDEPIKEFDWKKLIGHFLLKLKYKVLNYLENNQNVDSKESLENLVLSIETEKAKMVNSSKIINEINIFQILSAIEPIINALSQLKDEEKIEYKSLDGSAILNNKVTLNKGKILWELGNKEFESETTEILKIKKLDLLSNSSNWTFKFRNKQIEAKIIDQDWLGRYHARDYPLMPEDSLKVKLKIHYINKADGKIIKPTYEITKVVDIIYPDDNKTSSIF